jgi:hypothetical protein
MTFGSFLSIAGATILAIAVLLTVSWILGAGIVTYLRRKYNIKDEKAAELHLQAVGSLPTILGGLSILSAVLGGAYTIYKTNEELLLSRRGQLAERFTSALTTLEVVFVSPTGNNSSTAAANPSKPLGGIVALESIVSEANEYREPAARVLSSFIRTNSPRDRAVGTCTWIGNWLSTPASQTKTPLLLPDVHPSLEPHLLEAFKTLGRIRQRVDLTAEIRPALVDLKEAIDLSDTDLCIAYSKRGNFDFGWFRRADLSAAVLDGSSFRCGGFREAILDGAHLIEVQFDHADMRRADFGRAEVTRVDFRGTNLAGADLRRVSYDNSEQEFSAILAQACGNHETRIPEGLPRPAEWESDSPESRERSCQIARDNFCHTFAE